MRIFYGLHSEKKSLTALRNVDGCGILFTIYYGKVMTPKKEEYK